MKRITIFRILLVLYVILYAASHGSQGIEEVTWCSELHDYQQRLFVQFGAGIPPGGILYSLLWVLGHLVESSGLVLLFCRRRFGLWMAGVGAAGAACASWAMANPDYYPNLQTTTNGLLWSATSIVWGSCFCMALVNQRELFVVKQKSDPSFL